MKVCIWFIFWALIADLTAFLASIFSFTSDLSPIYLGISSGLFLLLGIAELVLTLVYKEKNVPRKPLLAVGVSAAILPFEIFSLIFLVLANPGFVPVSILGATVICTIAVFLMGLLAILDFFVNPSNQNELSINKKDG
jgi:hypothetical protein